MTKWSENLFLPEKDVRHERTQESGSVQTLRCSDLPRSLLRKSSLDAEHSCI